MGLIRIKRYLMPQLTPSAQVKNGIFLACIYPPQVAFLDQLLGVDEDQSNLSLIAALRVQEQELSPRPDKKAACNHCIGSVGRKNLG